MIPRIPFGVSLGGLVLAGLACILAVPVPAPGQQPAAPQQISEIEKQIEALQRKLAELRRANGGAIVTTPAAPKPATPQADWVKSLSWRCIGPAGMGGRITALSVYEADPSTYWVATASGGLLKTVNNGITFEHQFDREATVSIGDVCVAPSDRNIVWVGTGENNPRNSVSYGDGVYRSTDGGKTWKNMGLKKSFQIGGIVVHPKDPNIVYVGALGRLYGPNEERGLFKTTDGGKTWNKILYVDDKTGVIDICMNPKDPETLLVATWERQRDGFDSHRGEPPLVDGYDAYDPIKKWGPGGGIHKTTDGGKTFRRLTKGLPTNPLGRIGLDYYRKDPNVVYAIIDCEKIGMGTPPRPQRQASGEAYLGVTGDNADAGARLTQVVPGSPAARAGLQVGDIVVGVNDKPVFAYDQLVEQLRTRKPGEKLMLRLARNREGKEVAVSLEARPAAGPGPLQQGGTPTRPYSYLYGGQRENVQDQQGPNSHEYGGVYRSSDGGESWTRINSVNPRPMYFSVLRVDPTDEKYLYVLGVSLYRSSDGGKTFRPDGNRNVHPDQHALWIDPRDGRHMIVGTDGGFYVTYDRMEHWDHLNHLALAQFYHVAVDNRRPYYVYGGLQDNGSWGGPSHGLKGSGPINEDWIMVSGGDGFVCRVDPSDPDLVYFESQDGFMGRRHLRNGERASIRPRDEQMLLLLSSVSLPFYLTGWSLPLTLPRTPQVQAQSRYRFNWNTPFLLSSHNPRIFYAAGNYVLRSLKRGDDLRVISPEIARTGRGTGTALAESPRNPDVLWAGTDDGNLWVTRDGGVRWTNVASRVGLPGPRWVASIEASRFAEGRAYVVFDAHRSDDDEPYVYVTEDFGQTWKSLRANLPTGSSRVLREDLQNPNLLYLGTEFAVWASLDRGATWLRLNNNLPTVAVHEFAVHPTAGEIVAATHGRGLWILDVTPLRQMTPEVLRAKAHLFEPNPAVRWRSEPGSGSMYGNGHRRFIGQNPPAGAQIYYALGKKADKIELKVLDHTGQVVREFTTRGEQNQPAEVRADPGLYRVTWDLTRAAPRDGPGGRGGFGGRRSQQAQSGSGTAASSATASPAGRGGFGPRQAAPPGVYRVVLTVDGEEFAQTLRVEADPTTPAIAAAPEGETDE